MTQRTEDDVVIVRREGFSFHCALSEYGGLIELPSPEAMAWEDLLSPPIGGALFED